ncbi:PREDICTED: sperm flagellar protein 2-like, partial [Fulmarus glacialis]|uniref:sperm flagellar protein 2-like n=1 Tax=Fulmarus glacialis TaxID=30455 RepID=UPI00051BB50B
NCPVKKDPSGQEFKSDNSQDGLSKLSVRAQLGAASQKLLKKGRSIPDELLIDILLEAINQTPPEKGWIVDGFPMTINQAKLFEKAYTGIDPEAKDTNSGKLSLVTDPRAPNKSPVISPAFDVSVLLDISDTVVLKRVANLKPDKLKSSQTEQENNNQNSDADTLEEKIDLARDQVLHRVCSRNITRKKAFIKIKFQGYLKHPDLKQEFVSQWQSDFNSIADDLREDEETKAELHQRVTDLRDLLWDICDNRREEAEQERTDIMNDGWLPDHRGIAMNHFFSLMQVEVDRFQDTKRLLHDYYRAMEGKIPTDDGQDFTRIPLLNIIDVEQKEDQNKSRRIPLVSWKLPSPEINITKSKSKVTLQKSAKDENSENGVATFGKDENLITDTWQTAVTAVSNMVTAEIQSKELEEEKERQQLELKEDLKSSKILSGKATGKDAKDAKKLSPKSATKKKVPPSTSSVVEVSPVPITPEELKKRELTLKIKEEYFSALKHE